MPELALFVTAGESDVGTGKVHMFLGQEDRAMVFGDSIEVANSTQEFKVKKKEMLTFCFPGDQ